MWGYGFLAVFLICLCALFGLLFIPCVNTDAYALALQTMMALAVSTLVGDAALHLIPQVSPSPRGDTIMQRLPDSCWSHKTASLRHDSHFLSTSHFSQVHSRVSFLESKSRVIFLASESQVTKFKVAFLEYESRITLLESVS